MKSNRIHAITGMLLSLVLLLCIPGGGIIVSAAEPPVTEYAEKDELLTRFGLTADSTVCRIKFGNGKEWHIAGQDGTDTIALLSSTSFGYSPFSEVGEDNIYGDDQKGMKSKVKIYLENCETDIYFSSSELGLIKNTSIKTEDASGNEHTVTGRLYLPAARNRDSYGGDTVYVGSNNDIPIVLSKINVASFWLRTPAGSKRGGVLTGNGKSIDESQKDVGQNVKPAMNLDLSSVLFASAVQTETGGTSAMASAMTLRFRPDANTVNGSVVLKGTDRAVKVSAAPSDAYLVVQKEGGAWVQRVSGERMVLPEEVTIGGSALNSFADCKVWLERTDADRITTAVMSVPGISDVTVTAGKNMTLLSGSETQTGLYGAMEDVVYEAAEGYYFPKDYAAGVEGQKDGVTIKRDSSKRITITGTPIEDTAIMLPDASLSKQPAVPILDAIIYSPVRTLADVALPAAEGGSWSWDDGTAVPEVRTASYPATFTPESESGYDVYRTDIVLKVEKAEPDISSVTGSGIYGQKLSEFAFAGSAVCDGQDVPGSFKGEEGELYPECGQTLQYDCKFIPDDRDNYNDVSGTAHVNVNKKPVTVSVKDAVKTYGDANPEFSLIVPDGTLGGDDTAEDLAVTFACNADETTGAGTVADITGNSAAANYEVTVENGTLTVNQRPIHIKVTDKDIRYKEPLPSSYDFTLSNLVNGADVVSVGTAVRIEPQKVPTGNPAGSYVLKVTDWSIKDSNYTKGQSRDGILTIYEDMSGHGVKGAKTGDITPLIELAAMAVISAVIIIAVTFRMKKRRK